MGIRQTFKIACSIIMCVGAAALGGSSAAAPPPEQPASQPAKPVLSIDLYTLDICPVSGEKLDAMGEPVVKKFDGREVRFCCKACVGKFEADKATYFAKIDEKLIKQQKPYYPLDTCVVMGDSLAESEDTAVDQVYGNRLVRFCCKMCIKEFDKDPKKFVQKLDEAAAQAQRKAYPLETCVVGGGELGSMGEPVDVIVGGRLVRLCCKGCKPKLEKEPAKYLATVDAAWKAKKQ
jgi:YHS domain-containing protein